MLIHRAQPLSLQVSPSSTALLRRWRDGSVVRLVDVLHLLGPIHDATYTEVRCGSGRHVLVVSLRRPGRGPGRIFDGVEGAAADAKGWRIDAALGGLRNSPKRCLPTTEMMYILLSCASGAPYLPPTAIDPRTTTRFRPDRSAVRMRKFAQEESTTVLATTTTKSTPTGALHAPRREPSSTTTQAVHPTMTAIGDSMATR